MTSPLDNEERSFNILATLERVKQKMREESGKKRRERKKRTNPLVAFDVEVVEGDMRGSEENLVDVRIDSLEHGEIQHLRALLIQIRRQFLRLRHFNFFLTLTSSLKPSKNSRFWFLTGVFVSSKTNARNQKLTRTHSKQRTYLYSNFEPTQIEYSLNKIMNNDSQITKSLIAMPMQESFYSTIKL